MNEIVGRVRRVVGDATGVGLLAETFKKTAEKEWPAMNTRAKLGALAACGISFARPFRELVKLGQEDEGRDWGDTIGDVASAASDGLDGMIARGTGGKTTFGGVADQLVGDKWARYIKEASMARRGRMSWVHPIVRLGRDLAVTSYREKINRDAGGEISVDASPKRDVFSGKYSTVNYFASNALLDSPLGAEMPRWSRELIATMTDVHLVATGVANILRLRKLSQNRLNVSRER